jgi:hypothetical protein
MILLPQCGQSLTIIEVIDPSVWRLYPYNDQKIKPAVKLYYVTFLLISK